MGYQYDPPPRQRPPSGLSDPTWIIVAIVAAIVIPVALLTGYLRIGGSATQSGSSSFDTSAPTTAPTPYSVGDTIVVENVALTLNRAQVIAGDDFTHPRPGYDFVLVHITITNQSSSEIEYNPFNFHSWDGNGNIGDYEIFFPDSYTADNELHAGSLTPGGHRDGDLLFQFPQGDHQARMTWVYGFLSGDTDHAWLLGL